MKEKWVEALLDADWVFLKRFLLTSGSLKDLAKLYDVSYPTIRLRLDRLIQKILVYDTHDDLTTFERSLRGYYAEGQLSKDCFQSLLKAYKEEKEN